MARPALPKAHTDRLDGRKLEYGAGAAPGPVIAAADAGV
jgi:hypothetical protein